MSKITSKQIDGGDTIVLYRIRRKSDGSYRSKSGWGGSEHGSVFASIGHAKNHLNRSWLYERSYLAGTIADWLQEFEIVKLTFRKEFEEVMEF